MTEHEFDKFTTQVDSMVSVQKHMEGRLSALEDRVQAIETLASRVPGIEARIGRVERIMLEVQGEMRKMERTFNANHEAAVTHYSRIETKVDRLLSLLDKDEDDVPE